MANVAISIGVRVVLDDVILNLHLLCLFGLGPLDVEYRFPLDTEYLANTLKTPQKTQNVHKNWPRPILSAILQT